MRWQSSALLLELLALPGLFTVTAGEVPNAQIKGDALKEVLRPVPAKEPAEALRCLEVVPGFSVEFVAHEPLVLDPVAAAIDENGLMYVAEDADYPYKPEGSELPKGRIRVLKDNNGDGYYEESHLFAEHLLWPAGVAPWKGGVFVSAPPDIWYLKDTNGDFKADIIEKVYTGFGTAGSQYILNNLIWGLDHKIYVSVAGNGGLVRRADRPDQKPASVSHKDFRFDPVTKDFETQSGGKQFGNTFDDWGNRFLCTQDTAVYQVVFPEKYLERNPLLSIPETVKRLVPGGAPIFRTSPIEAWRAIRSSRRLLVEKGSPNASGVSHHVLDGVAGVTVYRGGGFPESFYGNVFCGDAQNNLVHRRSLVPDGVLFRSDRLDQGTEFLRSTDNWFRPVNFVNAPDGTLYVLDLAREVLEAVHIPMDVVSHLDLTSGRDRGRIYHVFPNGYKRPAQPNLGQMSAAELVACLESPHGWWRDTAHRLLYERQDKSAESSLRHMLQHSSRPQSRLHALWSLQGLSVLSDAGSLTALADEFPAVRENALWLAESRLNQSKPILARCVALSSDPNARVRFQLAFTLGESGDPLVQQFRKALELKGNAVAGQNTFQRLCSTCHRLNGIGNEVGPNLALAATRSPEELLVSILDPNREVNPAYIAYSVETIDGESLSGLIAAEQSASVTLKGPNLQQTIPRQRIKKILSSGQSLMPVGLEQGLNHQDIADLLSFLIEAQYDFGTSGDSFSRDMLERRG